MTATANNDRLPCDTPAQAYLVNDPSGNFVAATTAQVAPANSETWRHLTERVLGAAINAAPELDLDGLYAWVSSSDTEVGLTLTRLSSGSIADAIPGLELAEGTLGLLAVVRDEDSGQHAGVLVLPAMLEANGTFHGERTIAVLLNERGIAFPGPAEDTSAAQTILSFGEFLHQSLDNAVRP